MARALLPEIPRNRAASGAGIGGQWKSGCADAHVRSTVSTIVGTTIPRDDPAPRSGLKNRFPERETIHRG